MKMAEKKKIVIVGAGVTGCSIAYHLAKLGISSTIVERESVAARASGKAWAVSCYPPAWFTVEKDPGTYFFSKAEHGVRHWLDLFASGYYRMRDITMDIKQITGVDTGYYEMFSTLVANNAEEADLFKAELPWLHDCGAKEMQWIEKDEMQALYPGINEKFLGGLIWPGWTVEPYKFTLGLAQAAEKLAGVKIKQGEVVGFGSKDGRVRSVKLASGVEIDADTVVIAMGPWSGRGASCLDRNIPMGPLLEQCIRLEYDKPISRHMVLQGLAGFIPKPEGDFIFGISSQSNETFCEAEQPVRLKPETKFELMEALLDIYPDLGDAKIVEHRGDYMSFSPNAPNAKPVMGRLPGYENAYIAARLSVGMMAAAGVGRIMSEYVLTSEPPVHYKRLLEHLSPAKL
jgi:glycine oxidase